MRTLYLSLLLMVSLQLTSVAALPTQNITPPDSVTSSLKSKKSATDRAIKRYSKKIIVLAKVSARKVLVKVKDENWPDNLEYTFNILKDSAGRIIFIARMPYSESGDWFVSDAHYFDGQGNTYAFEHQENIFNDEVKGGAVKHIISKLYGEGFKNVLAMNKLTDANGKIIPKKVYDFPNNKYVIYKSLADCMVAYNIKLPLQTAGGPRSSAP